MKLGIQESKDREAYHTLLSKDGERKIDYYIVLLSITIFKLNAKKMLRKVLYAVVYTIRALIESSKRSQLVQQMVQFD